MADIIQDVDIAGALSAASLALGVPLPVDEGGTGADNASAARTNLGIEGRLQPTSGDEGAFLGKLDSVNFNSQWLYPKGGHTHFTVAAADTPASLARHMTVSADGTDDDEQVRDMVALGPTALGPGRFEFSATVQGETNGLQVVGAGLGANNPTIGYGTGTLVEPVASGFTGSALFEFSSSTIPGGHTGPDWVTGYCTIGNLALDGSANTTDVIDGIDMHGFEFAIFDAHIWKMSGSGVRTRGQDTDTHSLRWSTYNGVIHGCVIRDCLVDGFIGENQSADLHINDSTIALNGRDNIHFVDGSSVQISGGTHTYRAGRHNIHLQTGGGTRATLLGAKIENSLNGHGLFLNDADDAAAPQSNSVEVIVAGCRFNSNGRLNDDIWDELTAGEQAAYDRSTSPWSHIAVSGQRSANGLQVIGSTFGNSDGVANWAEHCIDLASKGEEAVIVGNNFRLSREDAGCWSNKIRLSSGAAGDAVRNTLMLQSNIGVPDHVGSDLDAAEDPVAGLTTPDGNVTSPDVDNAVTTTEADWTALGAGADPDTLYLFTS